MTLPRASTDAAARVPLCESIPIATSTLASFRRPTYDGGWRRTSRRRGRPSLLSSHFRRPGSGRRDDQVKGQRLSRGPRLAVSESPPAGSGHSRPKAEPPWDFIRLRFLGLAPHAVAPPMRRVARTPPFRWATRARAKARGRECRLTRGIQFVPVL